MLVVRDAQILALEESAFLAWLRKHLAKFFPDRCAALGTEGVERAMAEGIARARGYGFREHGDLSRYLDIAFALDLDFDRDPALAQLREWLVPGDNDDATARMDALVAAVEAHRRALIGDGGAG